MRPFYLIAYFTSHAIFRIVFHLSIKGRENIPDSGPFIAASNHVAYFDPVIIGSFLKHEIFFLARAELFEQFLLKDLIRKLNAFPVKRDKSDISSLKTCIHILQERKMPLLIFPEGTRNKTGELGVPQRGIAFVAAQTKVPILPIYIENSNYLCSCALFKKSLKVRIGKAIDYSGYKHLFEDRKQYFEFSQMIMLKIKLLKDRMQEA